MPAQWHNTVTLERIEPRTSRFIVRRSTTTPPRPLMKILVSIKGSLNVKTLDKSVYTNLHKILLHMHVY